MNWPGLGVAVTVVSRDLRRTHPELTHREREKLAAEFVANGWVALRNDGDAYYAAEIRAQCPNMPFASCPELDARMRGRRLETPAPPLAATPKGPTAEELQAQLDAVRGKSAEAEQSERARIRERAALERLGDSYNPTKENP